MSDKTIIPTSEPDYKDRLNMSYIFMKQLERTLQSVVNPDPSVWEGNVYALLDCLPHNCNTRVLANDGVYNNEHTVPVFQYYCTHKMGSVNDPLMKKANDNYSDLKSHKVKRHPPKIDWDDPNILERKNVGSEEYHIYEPVLEDESKPVLMLEGEIDWDDPNILSPRMVTTTETDYNALFRDIMHTAEEYGLTWRVDKHTELTAVESADQEVRSPYLKPQGEA